MEFSIQVEARAIEAMQQIAAKTDVRPYLNGVNLEVCVSESYLVASNGRRLAVFRVKQGHPGAGEGDRSIVIPNETLKGIKFGTGDARITVGAAEKGAYARNCVLEYREARVLFGSMDYRYPDWRRIVPPKATGEVAQFTAEDIACFHKAGVILRGRKADPGVAIGHNGKGSALVCIGHPDFFGIVTPIRPECVKVPASLPSWAA